MSLEENRKVLSIQSHVVHGYVGNKSATFPLQVLGFEVDAINSVQFSNHTGYNSFKGQILNADELGKVYDGLKENNITKTYTHLLTGYIGAASFLSKIKDVIKDLKSTNPDLIFVCDPVMGDNGKMYVPPELLPIYKDEIIPLADIITPNQYEAELLTDMKITDIETAKVAMLRLHEMGAKTVIISSSDLGSQEILVGLGSTVTNSKIGIKIEMPRIPANFTGTGDLFASLLLAWHHFHPHDLKLACEKTVSTLQAVLHRTYNYAKSHAEGAEKLSVNQLELRLIQSKSDIENPELCIKAKAL